VTDITEISLLGGERVQVEGDAAQIEASILSAARGSIMEFAWFPEAESGQHVGVNPEHVVMLRRVRD
jgi:hypothetical protein